MGRRATYFFVCLLLCAVWANGQSAPSIMISGAGAQPLMLTVADLAKMPRAIATTTGGGTETKYAGVWLYELLKKAGAPLGEQLRGEALTAYVLAEAADGYQVVFSLGELDPALFDNQVLAAATADGKPLFGGVGAVRIVAARDKRAARSVRMLTKLEIVQLRK
jgi:hypothetical protein